MCGAKGGSDWDGGGFCVGGVGGSGGGQKKNHKNQ